MNSSPDRIHPSAVSDTDALDKDVAFDWTVAFVASIVALPLLAIAAPVLWIVGRTRRSK